MSSCNQFPSTTWAYDIVLLDPCPDGDEIVYHDYYDISIAVATPKGLVVPVLRDADKLGFADIEKVCGIRERMVWEGGEGLWLRTVFSPPPLKSCQPEAEPPGVGREWPAVVF